MKFYRGNEPGSINAPENQAANQGEQGAQLDRQHLKQLVNVMNNLHLMYSSSNNNKTASQFRPLFTDGITAPDLKRSAAPRVQRMRTRREKRERSKIEKESISRRISDAAVKGAKRTTLAGRTTRSHTSSFAGVRARYMCV